MSILSILLLSIGLAVDATAVAATRGVSATKISFIDAAKVAGLFGGLQALMPLGGWYLGTQLGRWISIWGPFFSGAVFAALGLKMLSAARRTDVSSPSSSAQRIDALFETKTLFLLGLATSLDALVAGITLPLLNAPVWFSISMIGLVTAILSVAGLLAGRYFAQRIGKKLDAVGGCALLAMAAQVILQRMV
jgi:manganese efflux pump family protein